MNLDNLRQRLQNKQIYIYGAGIYATILYAYLQFYGMERQVIGFVVTKKENNVDRFFDKPIYAYSVDIMEKQAAFCIAIKGAYDIEDRLRKDGFGDVCLIAGQVISEIKECIFAEFSNLPIQRTKIFFHMMISNLFITKNLNCYLGLITLKMIAMILCLLCILILKR